MGKPIILAGAIGFATYGCYRLFRDLIDSDLWLFIFLLVFGALNYIVLITLFERHYFLMYFWLFLGQDRKEGLSSAKKATPIRPNLPGR